MLNNYQFEKTLVECNGLWLDTWYHYNSNYIYREAYMDMRSSGHFHRSNGPAVIFYSPYGKVVAETYYFHGKEHRECGPSHTSYNDDGIITFVKFKINNRLHRLDGPAMYIMNSTGEMKEHYFLLDRGVSKEKFETPGFIDAFILEHS